MTQDLEQKLKELKTIEDQIKLLDEEKTKLRDSVFRTLKEENLKTYSGEIATVSQVERKSVKYKSDKDVILARLEEQKLVKYFEVIPEEIIPEHKEFTKDFEKDIKDGKLELEDVEVDVKTNPMIKFK